VLLLLALAAEDCAGCHAVEAAAFATSRHAQARRLPVFTRSFAQAQTPWCLSCHQPEGAGEGLRCQTCHGAMAAVKSGRPPSAKALEAHPVTVEADFEMKACARCHEFTSPLPGHLWPVVLSNESLQATVSEQRAAMPGARCATCHDPHRAAGAHDAVMLRKAIAVSAEAVDGGVEIALEVGRTGHRFPTGDVFRRLLVSTCLDPECSAVAGRQRFSRSIGSRDGGAWTTVRDTTLAPNRRVVLVLPSAPFWRARYFFGDPRFERGLPEDEVFVELGGGALR
jgi:hypothetical protein